MLVLWSQQQHIQYVQFKFYQIQITSICLPFHSTDPIWWRGGWGVIEVDPVYLLLTWNYLASLSPISLNLYFLTCFVCSRSLLLFRYLYHFEPTKQWQQKNKHKSYLSLFKKTLTFCNSFFLFFARSFAVRWLLGAQKCVKNNFKSWLIVCQRIYL